MNLGGIDYSASVNSRQFVGNSQIPINGSFTTFSNTYALDPKQPYFRVFAGIIPGTAVTSDLQGFASQYAFTLGGVPSGTGSINVAWGTDTTYNGGLTPCPFSGLNVFFLNTLDLLVAHSQYAYGCIGVSGYESTAGFSMRWTALADQVVITTSVIGAPYVPTVATEICHGVLQQPW